ncbi:MAG TPA: hypothetical protein VKS98_09390 [Chthoniobacterales bacterium]|nr:hypothetical protein [Chthoniobacterales bacterium]
MKKTTLKKLLAVACGFVAVSAFAQTSTTVTTKDGAAGTTVSETSTTTATGTFATYTPGSDYFTFESRGTTGAPAKYYYDRNTTVLDPEGRTVTWSAVRPDMPATVYYVREGDRMIVRKVILTKAPNVIEKQTTTTTTTTNEKEHH